MNELFFLCHACLTGLSCLVALRLGRSALTALVALQAIIANLFVLKQITLLGLSVTCSDVYMIGSILSLNLLQEFFGERSARHATRAAFFCLIFFGLMGQMHLIYRPSPEDTLQPAYAQLLGQMPRLVIASFAAYALSAAVSIGIFRSLARTKWPLPLRSALSIGLSQIFDTLVFAFAGLFGLVAHIWHVILISLAVKLVVVSLSAPFAFLSQRIRRAT